MLARGQGQLTTALRCRPLSYSTTAKLHSQPAKTSLRLMPLGDSITFGQGSTHGNGYRNSLSKLLRSDGYKLLKMVGSQTAGTMPNNANEGWPGYRIDQIQGKAEQSVPRFLPNLFTLIAGTNDCVQDFEIDDAGERMDLLLEYLWYLSPGSTVILSTLIVNAARDVEGRVLRVNDQLRQLADRRAAQEDRIVLVDMHDADDGPRLNELVDGTHPNDAAYNKMAKIWYRGIKAAESKSFLQNPRPLPGDDDDDGDSESGDGGGFGLYLTAEGVGTLIHH